MHPAEKYVGMAYCSRTFDCCDFVLHVLSSEYGMDVRVDARRPRGAAGRAALGELSKQRLVPAPRPRDGDVVLMRTARGWHVGLHYNIHGEPWVLHCPADRGHSVLDRARDAHIKIEGYYTWPTAA